MDGKIRLKAFLRSRVTIDQCAQIGLRSTLRNTLVRNAGRVIASSRSARSPLYALRNAACRITIAAVELKLRR